MKVYSKKNINVAGPGLATFIGLLFTGIPSGYFIYLFNILTRDKDEFFEVFWNGLMLTIFALFFFVIGLIILYYVLKRPIKRKAKLMSKERCKYKDEYIFLLTFQVDKDECYECFTKEDNDFLVGYDYIVAIKEAYYKIVKVLPYGDSINLKDTNQKDNLKVGINIFLLGISLFFILPVTLLWIKIIFDIMNNTLNKDELYVIIILTFGAFLVSVMVKRLMSDDNKKLDISNFKILEDTNKIIRYAPRKEVIKEMFIMLIFWIFIEILFMLMINPQSTEDFIIIIIVCSFPLVFLEIFQLFKLSKYFNFDNKTLKNNNIVLIDYPLIEGIHNLKVIKVSDDVKIYYIIDNTSTLLYKIIKKSWNSAYYILNHNDKLIGEIKRLSSKYNYAYLIRLVNKTPIALEPSKLNSYSYFLYNSDIEIIRNSDSNKNTLKLNKKDIGYINFNTSKQADIILNEDTRNNEELVMIATTVILGGK